MMTRSKSLYFSMYVCVVVAMCMMTLSCNAQRLSDRTRPARPTRPGYVVPVAPSPVDPVYPVDPVDSDLTSPGEICAYLYSRKKNNACNKPYEYTGHSHVGSKGEFSAYGGKFEKCPNDASRCVRNDRAEAEKYCRNTCPLNEFEEGKYYEVRKCKSQSAFSSGQSGWQKQALLCKYREAA